MASSKIRIEDFKTLDAPDKLLNIWSYNNLDGPSKKCRTCKKYSNFCEMLLREQWKPNWGDFEFIIEKIKNNDKTFIDLSEISSMNRWKIIDILVKKNKNVKNI